MGHGPDCGSCSRPQDLAAREGFREQGRHSRSHHACSGDAEVSDFDTELGRLIAKHREQGEDYLLEVLDHYGTMLEERRAVVPAREVIQTGVPSLSRTETRPFLRAGASRTSSFPHRDTR